MRICLSMIVKNEAAVIERCLRAVRPHIHAWAISDTGSTDGTQDIIRNTLGDLPGELIERPWVDFSTNRNEALALAAKHGDYALLIDADDIIEASGFGKLTADCYDMGVQFRSLTYSQPHLIRLGHGFFYTGVTHEYIDCNRPYSRDTLKNAIYRIGDDGARRVSGRKFVEDAGILEKALAADPGNTRYQFYLAQSYRDGGLVDKAIAAYANRATMGGWDEEVYYSMLQMAVLKEGGGASPGVIVDAYLDAYNYRPTRAEAPCELARYFRLRQRHVLARDFARVATGIAQPDDRLFMDQTVYDWRARDELSIALYWCNERDESARLCRELLADPRLPREQHDRVTRNLAFAIGDVPG
ncbi:glycosyltransferase [Cupriavidus metallidurans]|uniref:tetratricopeptide repeat-containing glycosyltransferase n=1 Tax=Cupriavidus metallidurans TaxID=119219 RepID=UPI001CCB6CFB|nr:glycosyltransferase [Cupriavidus metallidurans]UBM09249.1 glycosyltransferase [Cupriavidus metallidurans]